MRQYTETELDAKISSFVSKKLQKFPELQETEAPAERRRDVVATIRSLVPSPMKLQY